MRSWNPLKWFKKPVETVLPNISHPDGQPEVGSPRAAALEAYALSVKQHDQLIGAQLK